MKKLLYFFLVIFMISLVFSSCSSSGQNRNAQVVVNQVEPSVGENLDLRAVGEVVKSSSNPQEIEQKLNSDNGINNLDLDGDGNRDYLKVTEYGQGAEHGYSICAVLSDGEPEVANVVVDTRSQQMHLNGNTAYYGTNNYYSTGISPSEMLLWAYLMRPNYVYYHSPYHYGYYGYGYAHRPIVSYSSYRTRSVVHTSTTRTYNKPATRTTHSIKSPNASNKSSVAAKRTSNFSNATQSQKSFKVREKSSAPLNTSGFGNKSSNKTTTTPAAPAKKTYSPPKQSSPSSSSTPNTYKSSSKSGFGSSSRSSSSSSRSSSSSSRSSSRSGRR